MKKKTESLTLYLSPTEKRALKKSAHAAGRSMAAHGKMFIVHAILREKAFAEVTK